MILIILLTALVCILIVFVILIAVFFRRFLRNFDYFTGFILDNKVDEIFRKSTIIGELYARERKGTENEKLNFAYERACAIASDVLLQNGLNPREYHLEGLVKLQRYFLGFKLLQGGGDNIGKS